MSTSVPQRGRLTDALVAYLEESTELSTFGILVGDQVAPVGAGYVKGAEPGDTDGFVASVTLTTGIAIQGDAPDTVRSAHTNWKMVYGLRSVGGSRSQADFAADCARTVTAAFPIEKVDLGDSWQVQRLLFTRLAPMREQRTTDVPTFVLDDLIEVWVTRSVR